MEIHFISDPLLVDDHEWRLSIIEFWIMRGKKRQHEMKISYQWRAEDAALWNFERTWPGYHEAEPFNGLPSGLDVLYEANYSIISKLLGEDLIQERSDPDNTGLIDPNSDQFSFL
ncbi:hypothetical protein [Kiloniella sp.]|uniref:hypothetical protein n=1 Tax=Kiloniella sp. TaxID=1938587 RepID=UPI003B029A50